MTIAADLLQRHILTLVADNAQWQTLITDDLVWELPYAPTIGHPARLAGREEVVGFVTWFVGAVDHFRFTSQLQQSYDTGQKMVLAEIMWGVVLADGKIVKDIGSCSAHRILEVIEEVSGR